MIVDSSAVLAIFFSEPEAPEIAHVLVETPEKRMSAANYLEAAIVLDNAATGGALELDDFLRDAEIEIEPVTMEQARIARQAHRRFGKGRSAAQLNFGDCFAYALARFYEEPLLYKGEDFTNTEVVSAFAL